ncbi:diguanylate cyclase domain-containing protein [Butyrivibrio sp. VCB2006]|uniref:diguanylate cyclase domain-containing protein n=1 Tax=Butyrivibrio sp. VCB2006 TaxID=1280679 RepID=UPI00040B953E|nr:diguanylate cyclase [Butyrivibrio sp. VCB2006]
MFMNMKRAKLIAWGMAICFLFIHVLMLTVFWQCGVKPMAYFNIFSIVFYLFMLYVVHKELLPFYAVTVYLEVALHMTLAVILTGWGSGFQVTLIGMNVLAFYAEYTGRSLKLKFVPVLPMGILGMILYLGTCVYLQFYPAPYSLPQIAEFWLSILWGVIVFVINLFVLQLLVLIVDSSEKQLEYQLSHDKLTGLPNRYFLSKHFEKLHSDNKPYWIAISDIDDFKKVNDVYGHNCGDYVLKKVGEILSGKGAMCGRWGGEEFIFAQAGSEKLSDPYDFLNDLRKAIKDYPFEYDGQRVKVTMTFGLACSSEGKEIDDIIRDADEKLYAGKHSGKNVVVDDKHFEKRKMTDLQDPLTHVKNKLAYEKMEESLGWDIQKHTAQFAIVRVLLHNSNEINDRFGIDKKNKYIIGACRIICSVFMNSQVFRVDQDEFLVVLTNRDYYDRDDLLLKLKDKYTETINNSMNEPWERYHADCLVETYSEKDSDVASVVRRLKEAK